MSRYPTLSGETLVVPIVGDPIAQVKSLAAHCATLTDRARFLGSVNVARRNPDGGSAHGSRRVHPTRTASTSLPTPPRWACGTATRTRSTSPG